MSQSYGRLVFILLGVGVAVFACWKIAQRVDAFLYPWANERSGLPTLTGAWMGYAKTPAGSPLGVLLELHRRRPEQGSECGGCDTLLGRAVTCDDKGVQLNYRVSGKPADRRATRFSLGAAPVDPARADEMELAGIRGTWRTNDLVLEIELREPHRVSASGADSEDGRRSIRLAMKRAAVEAFRARCEGISQGMPR